MSRPDAPSQDRTTLLTHSATSLFIIQHDSAVVLGDTKTNEAFHIARSILLCETNPFADVLLPVCAADRETGITGNTASSAATWQLAQRIGWGKLLDI